MYVLLFQVRPVFQKNHRLESKLCTSNQTEPKLNKMSKELWTRIFFKDSSYCSTYFEILNPVPRQSTSFSYTFSCHFKGLYLCVYTQNTRTSQGKIFRHSIPNHDGSKPVMMMKNEGLCFCTLKRFDGIFLIRFIYSEKVKKFCENFTLLLSYVVPAKSKVKISQNFVAFSEYINFNFFQNNVCRLDGQVCF